MVIIGMFHDYICIDHLDQLNVCSLQCIVATHHSLKYGEKTIILINFVDAIYQI